jgi:hypothetical protein
MNAAIEVLFYEYPPRIYCSQALRRGIIVPTSMWDNLFPGQWGGIALSVDFLLEYERDRFEKETVEGGAALRKLLEIHDTAEQHAAEVFWKLQSKLNATKNATCSISLEALASAWSRSWGVRKKSLCAFGRWSVPTMPRVSLTCLRR